MKVKTFLTLCRASNLPTVWMNAIAATALTTAATGAKVSPSQFLAVLIGLSCFYAGGMSFNDFCDRHRDSENQTFRPIPAGKVSAQSVLILSISMFVVGLGLLAQTGASLVASLGLLSLIIAYDTLHKKYASTVLLMAGTRFAVYMVAAFTISQSPPTSVYILGLIQAIYTLLVTLVARYENGQDIRFKFPLIPWMLACMAIIDGIVLAWLLSPVWLLPAIAILACTRLGQRYIKGD